MESKFFSSNKLSLKDSLGVAVSWAIIPIIFIVIIGSLITQIQSSNYSEAVYSLQKLLLITGIGVIAQVLIGHKLPISFGPSMILLVCAISTASFDLDAYYTAILICSLISLFFSLFIVKLKLFSILERIFTPTLIATILLIVPISIMPTINNILINDKNINFNLCLVIFLGIFAFLLFVNRKIKGASKNYLQVAILIGGTMCYYFYFPIIAIHENILLSLTDGFLFKPVINYGVILSCMICYGALIANDIGSIIAISSDVHKKLPDDTQIQHGVTITSIINTISSVFGVIGGVNYSLSKGSIVGTKSISLFPVILSGIFLVIIAFIPNIGSMLLLIPSILIAPILFYNIVNMFAGSLYDIATKDLKLIDNAIKVSKLIDNPTKDLKLIDNAIKDSKLNSQNTCFIISISLLIGCVIVFLPGSSFTAIPVFLQPIVQNAFVVCFISTIILEKFFFPTS